jgi:hypothetical protein
VKRGVLWLTTILLLAACESSANPLEGVFGGGGPITPAQATGNWSFTVQRTTTLPCTTAPLADGQVITAHLDVLSDGTVATTSSWVKPVSGAVEPLTGSVTLTTGSTDLTFAAPDVSSTAAMELRGTMTSAGTVTGGTLTDPAPGFTQVFGTGGCEYTATGTKTS